MAARKISVHAKPSTLGYQFATEKVIAGASEELRRETLRMLTSEIATLEDIFGLAVMDLSPDAHTTADSLSFGPR